MQGRQGERYPFYKVSDMNLPGNERLMSTANHSISEAVRKQLRANVFSAGTIIFPKVGGAIATNKKRKISMDCCVDNNVMGLIPNEDVLDADFLYYLMQNTNLYDFSNRANPPSIRQMTVEAWPIVLPKSISEQKRIVAILDEAFEGVDAAVANAEKNLANARELFESYLQTIFARQAVGWTKKPLAAVCKKITVGHVGSMAHRYQESGIPFLRSQNVRPFEITMDNVTFIDDAFHKELNKSQLRPGDLAIVRTGYPGTAAVIPPWLIEANCSDLVIIRPGQDLMPEYLESFFNSSFGKKLVLGKLVGAAQKHFNVTAAKEVVLHYPPAREQATVVAEIKQLRDEAKRLETLYEGKIAALAKLKQAVLAKAFAGELTAQPERALPEAAE